MRLELPTKLQNPDYGETRDSESAPVARIVSCSRATYDAGVISTEEEPMFATKRFRMLAAASAVVLASAGIAVAVTTSASATAKPAHATTSASPAWRHHHHHPKLSLNRFDLNGYVINADYTLGRNTGNTFQQTYGDSTVQGVPIKGPFVGTKFPQEDYVAIPISRDQLYITWLDPSTFAIVDVFVMNFKTHTVYDYAPGSAHPESAGTIKVVHRGATPIP
jgi:hypothetical protein